VGKNNSFLWEEKAMWVRLRIRRRNRERDRGQGMALVVDDGSKGDRFLGKDWEKEIMST
jgi:hypothetical protein